MTFNPSFLGFFFAFLQISFSAGVECAIGATSASPGSLLRPNMQVSNTGDWSRAPPSPPARRGPGEEPWEAARAGATASPRPAGEGKWWLAEGWEGREGQG